MTTGVAPGALINAVRFSTIDTVKKLLAQGADVNEKDNTGNTALHYAAGRKDFTHITRLLLDNGARTNEKGHFGNTPLIWAVSACNAEMVRFLLGKGANPLERNNVGYTALGIAEARGFSEIVHVLKKAEEARRILDAENARRAAEKARAEAAHARVARNQERLNKIADRFRPE